MLQSNQESPLIVALDFNNQNDAVHIIEQLDPNRCALKVGNELFTRLGPQFVSYLVNKRFRVFLDLKYHDIPNTVSQACKAAADLGVWMINVHASGGTKMMEAARQALESYGVARPLIIGVTILTSLDASDILAIGIPKSIDEQVNALSLLAKEAGLDGVVCSALEVKQIKQLCGQQILAVTPGIRLSSNNKDDQTRIMTPIKAMQEGSDYLVIGRPITQAEHPIAVLDEILSTIATGI